MVRFHNYNGERIQFTAEEETERDLQEKEFNDASADRKLNLIKEIRLQKLIETDFWVLRGDITDAQKLYRKNLRDIPSNHTDEDAYDLLLARDSDKKLTHSVWTKP